MEQWNKRFITQCLLWPLSSSTHLWLTDAYSAPGHTKIDGREIMLTMRSSKNLKLLIGTMDGSEAISTMLEHSNVRKSKVVNVTSLSFMVQQFEIF